MARPVTLFTGQWADLPLDEMLQKARDFGYDGVELACWGDHMDVREAASNDGYVREKKELLEQYGMQCFAISNHLAGQAVCDNIDARHQAILPPHVWDDGDPEGVRQRAAEEMKTTAEAAKAMGLEVVNGFTGVVDLASVVFVSPGVTRSDRRRLSGFCGSLESDLGRVSSLRRAFWPGGASNGNRV